MATVHLNSFVAASKEQIASEFAGETAILNFSRNAYYGLDGVGARIWNLIADPVEVRTLRDAILCEYDVPGDRCDGDLLSFLDRMVSEGLVDIVARPSPGAR